MNEKEVHLKLSEIKIDNDNLDYIKMVGEICGKLRDDLVKLFAIPNTISNEITIDMKELLNVEDDSITDYEIIRQIGLLSYTKNDISENDRKSLIRKVKKEFQYCGLYPTVINKLDI